jgi:hypothetical protein
MYKTIVVALLASLALALGSQSKAAVIYSTAGATYSQNFDTLPNSPENVTLGATPIGWTDDNSAPGSGNFSIVGWYLFHPIALAEGGFSGGTTGNHRMRIGNGSANTGAFMSFGATGTPSPSTERAFGSLASGTLTATNAFQYLGLRVTNNTGATLNQFTLSYNGEQWRNGGFTSPATASLQQKLTFEYSLTAATLQDLAGQTAVPALDFSGPVFGAAVAAAVDGNTTGRVAIGPVTVTGLSWTPGTDLWIRWGDKNDPDNDHGLAIDDVSFSADVSVVPEPASFALIGIAATVLLAARRRK